MAIRNLTPDINRMDRNCTTTLDSCHGDHQSCKSVQSSKNFYGISIPGCVNDLGNTFSERINRTGCTKNRPGRTALHELSIFISEYYRTRPRPGNLDETPCADPHAGCCGGWGIQTTGYPISHLPSLAIAATSSG